MTLRARLALGIFVIGLLLLVPLLLATRSMESLGIQTEELRAKDFAASTLLGQLRAASEDFSDAELALGVDTMPALVFPRVTVSLDRLTTLSDSLRAVGFGDRAPEVAKASAELLRLSERELSALLARQTAVADAISADSIPPTLL